MQEGFVSEPEVAAVPGAAEIIPNINAISKALRVAGGRIVYVQHLVDDKAIREWSTYYENFVLPERVNALMQDFRPGSAAFELSPMLEADRDGLRIRKRRFGAFVPGSSNLHEILLAADIDTVIVTGITTNVCCESTARDAARLNYRGSSSLTVRPRLPIANTTPRLLTWHACSRMCATLRTSWG